MDDEFKNRPRGFSYGFGSFGNNANFSFNVNDEFLNTIFRHDFDQMFRDMENIMNKIGIPIISNIEFVESPQIDESNYGEFDENKKENLRNMFLKSPDEDRKEAEIVSNKPEFNRSWFNDFVFGQSHSNNSQNRQTDDINKYFKQETSKKDNLNLNPVINSPNIITSGQSCSIRRIQRPDGSIEEIKTVKNSDGIEEKTITRIIGDKVHSVVEKKTLKGVDETEEIFHNFDQEKIDEFNKMWDNLPNDRKNVTKNTNINQTESFSLISKLFSWFK